MNRQDMDTMVSNLLPLRVEPRVQSSDQTCNGCWTILCISQRRCLLPSIIASLTASLLHEWCVFKYKCPLLGGVLTEHLFIIISSWSLKVWKCRCTTLANIACMSGWDVTAASGHPEHLTPLNFIFVQIFWWIQTRDGLDWSLWGSTEWALWAGRLQVMLLCCGHIMSCSSCSGGVTLTLQWLQKYCSIIFHILHSATLISNDQQSHLVAASNSRDFRGILPFIRFLSSLIWFGNISMYNMHLIQVLKVLLPRWRYVTESTIADADPLQKICTPQKVQQPWPGEQLGAVLASDGCNHTFF